MEQPITLLHAIEEGFVEGVRRLLLLGVSTKDKDCDPLVSAVRLGHVDIVRLLLIAGSDPNTLDGSAIISAARLNDTRMADVLWRAGADLSVLDGCPMRVAQSERNTEMVEWLRKRTEHHVQYGTANLPKEFYTGEADAFWRSETSFEESRRHYIEERGKLRRGDVLQQGVSRPASSLP